MEGWLDRGRDRTVEKDLDVALLTGLEEGWTSTRALDVGIGGYLIEISVGQLFTCRHDHAATHRRCTSGYVFGCL